MNVVRSSDAGTPWLYVNVSVLKRVADVDVSLRQSARLERNSTLDFGVTTWSVGYLAQNVTDQAIRNIIKDKVDEFLNTWLSVNPKK